MTVGPLAAGIADLAALLDGTDITRLWLREGPETVTLHRSPKPASHPPGAPPVVPGQQVSAPCPGILLLRHPLREVLLAVPGQAVAAGHVLGLLQIGPLLRPVVAAAPGTLAAVLAAEGALVGYGTPLFRLSAPLEDVT